MLTLSPPLLLLVIFVGCRPCEPFFRTRFAKENLPGARVEEHAFSTARFAARRAARAAMQACLAAGFAAFFAFLNKYPSNAFLTNMLSEFFFLTIFWTDVLRFRHKCIVSCRNFCLSAGSFKICDRSNVPGES